MKKILYIAFFVVGCIIVLSCSDDEVITQQSIVRDTQTDMQVLSRFIDINEFTNEYYINENKKTRALSYVTGADWKELEKVSPINLERCERKLRDLNAQITMAIENPNVTYIVFSVDGKTLVKKLRDASFDFVSSYASTASKRALPYSLEITGGSDFNTKKFKDANHTIRMDVDLGLNIQANYYFFEVLRVNAKTASNHNTSNFESVVFSGTNSLWNTSFFWMAYGDEQGSDGLFSWEFKSKGSIPSSGHIAHCAFSY